MNRPLLEMRSPKRIDGTLVSEYEKPYEMVLTNQNGDVSSRRLRMNTLENKNPEDGDWNLIVFDEPRDIKGATLLTYAHILDPDDQWFSCKESKENFFNKQIGTFYGFRICI